MLEALGFFALAEVVGLAAAPLAGLAFGRLPGAGLGFAKPLGLLLVQLAKARGARVIGTVSTEEKEKLAREAGADEVIRYDREDFAKIISSEMAQWSAVAKAANIKMQQ